MAGRLHPHLPGHGSGDGIHGRRQSDPRYRGQLERNRGDGADDPSCTQRGSGGPVLPTSGALGSLDGGSIIKYLLLIAFDGLALWGIIRMVELQSWIPLVVTVVCTLAVNLVYWGRGRIPGKYLLPLTIFLVVYAIIPVIYNVYVSFTNCTTGNLITKEQAIDRLENQTLPASETAAQFRVDAVPRWRRLPHPVHRRGNR